LPKNPDRQDLIKIEVIDCGVGISPEQKQVIFEKYEVGNIVLGVSQIGLGLSFCKMMIEAHKGPLYTYWFLCINQSEYRYNKKIVLNH
jgi:K+-sensing histidine kinase KdpD